MGALSTQNIQKLCYVEPECYAWTYRGREGGCNVEMQSELAYAVREPAGGGSMPNVIYNIPPVWPETARSVMARHDSSPCIDRGQNIVVTENPEDDTVRILNPWDSQGNQVTDADGVYHCVRGCGGGGISKAISCTGTPPPAAFMGGQGAKARTIAYTVEASPSIKSVPSGGNTVPDVVYPINTMVATRGGRDDMRTCFGIGEPGDPQFTISAAHGHGVCYPVCCIASTCTNAEMTDGSISPALLARGGTGGGTNCR